MELLLITVPFLLLVQHNIQIENLDCKVFLASCTSVVGNTLAVCPSQQLGERYFQSPWPGQHRRERGTSISITGDYRAAPPLHAMMKAFCL